MLELILNNKVIPVPVNFEMQVTINFPFWRFDKIPASYSVDFNIPVNEYTSAIFAHPERVTKKRTGNESKFTGFEIRAKGSRCVGGTLAVTTEKGQYNCTFKDFVGELSDAQQQDSLIDLLAFAEEEDFVETYNYNPDVHRYATGPIVNSGFFTDRGVKVTRAVRDENNKKTDETYEIEVMNFCFQKGSSNLINNKTDLSGLLRKFSETVDITQFSKEKNNTYENCRVSVVTPFFFLKNVIHDALKNYGFRINENVFLTDTFLKNLVLYNNFDITKTEFIYNIGSTIPIYKTGYRYPGEQINQPTPWIISLGKWISGYNRNYPGKITPKNHLPKMTVGELLLAAQNYLNVVFDFRPDGKVNIFWRDELLTRTPVNLQKYLLGEIMPGEQKISAINFKCERDDNDKIVKERYTDLSNRIKDIKFYTNTWEELAAITTMKEGDIAYMSATKAYYQYKWITAENSDQATAGITYGDYLGWEEASLALQDGWYNYGQTEVIKIETKFSTCYDIDGFVRVDQPGNQASWKELKESFSPRLLIYKSANEVRNNTATHSLDYEGPTGIIAKRWPRTAKALANQLPITMRLDLSVNALRSIIFNKCIPYRTNDCAFIFDKLTFSIGTRRISTVEAEAYKI